MPMSIITTPKQGSIINRHDHLTKKRNLIFRGLEDSMPLPPHTHSAQGSISTPHQLLQTSLEHPRFPVQGTWQASVFNKSSCFAKIKALTWITPLYSSSKSIEDCCLSRSSFLMMASSSRVTCCNYPAKRLVIRHLSSARLTHHARCIQISSHTRANYYHVENYPLDRCTSFLSQRVALGELTSSQGHG